MLTGDRSGPLSPDAPRPPDLSPVYLTRSLADHLHGLLVVAQPEEARLAQPTVACPLGKADLRDELGPGPMRASRDRPGVDERRLGRFEHAQAGAELTQRRRAVSGADLAGIAQSILLVVADEQRTEVR